MLSLAGVKVPEAMQGLVFLGPEASPEPEYVYGFRDRVDEAFDLSRSVRSKRYLYIRNYLTRLSWAQPSVYSDLGAIQQEIFRHAADPKNLTKPQAAYAGPERPIEEFYDVTADPLNLTNLLDGEMNADQKSALEAHRAAFVKIRGDLLDLGVLPESQMVDFVVQEQRPLREIALGLTAHRPDLKTIWAAADLVGKGMREDLLERVHDGDAAVRFWTILALRQAYPKDKDLLEEIYDSMDDVDEAVRIEAAAWMADVSDKHREEAVQVIGRELISDEWWTALRACRAVEELGVKAAPLIPVMETLYERNRFAEGDGPMCIAFSAGVFLKKWACRRNPGISVPVADPSATRRDEARRSQLGPSLSGSVAGLPHLGFLLHRPMDIRAKTVSPRRSPTWRGPSAPSSSATSRNSASFPTSGSARPATRRWSRCCGRIRIGS